MRRVDRGFVARGAIGAILLLTALAASSCIDLTDDFRLRSSGNLDAAYDYPLGPPPDWSPDTVRVATFNVERFFDTVCDSGQCGPDDFELQLSEAQFAARADQLATAIRTLDADIVLLEEVENQTALDGLMERLPDQFRTAVIGETGSPASIDVAVLLNGRIVDVVTHRNAALPLPGGGTTTFTRELLEVHIALSEGAVDSSRAEVIVFVAHFKSKANDDPARRLAEAQAAHDIVAAVADQYDELLVLLGGDLNDVPGSPPINALEAGGELIRVAGIDLPTDQQATYGSEAIDHLFLADNGGADYETGSAQVFRNDSDGWGGSDHAALVAEFQIDVERIAQANR